MDTNYGYKAILKHKPKSHVFKIVDQKNLFKSFNKTAEDLYKQRKIHKFEFNLVSLQNYLFMCKLEQHMRKHVKMFAGITHEYKT